MPGATDSYMIFDNCFVPWERVFLAGEHQHGGVLALLFALFHRHSYSGCKPAIGDVILGTAALAAEVNNIHKESHVREKLAEIIMTSELGYAAGYTASDLGKPEVYIPGIGFVPYGPGSYIPHSIYCNVGRCLSGEAVFREAEILCDISGGVTATFPHEKDFANPATGRSASEIHQAQSENDSPRIRRSSGAIWATICVPQQAASSMWAIITAAARPSWSRLPSRHSTTSSPARSW